MEPSSPTASAVVTLILAAGRAALAREAATATAAGAGTTAATTLAVSALHHRALTTLAAVAVHKGTAATAALAPATATAAALTAPTATTATVLGAGSLLLGNRSLGCRSRKAGTELASEMSLAPPQCRKQLSPGLASSLGASFFTGLGALAART